MKKRLAVRAVIPENNLTLEAQSLQQFDCLQMPGHRSALQTVIPLPQSGWLKFFQAPGEQGPRNFMEARRGNQGGRQGPRREGVKHHKAHWLAVRPEYLRVLSGLPQRANRVARQRHRRDARCHHLNHVAGPRVVDDVEQGLLN